MYILSSWIRNEAILPQFRALAKRIDWSIWCQMIAFLSNVCSPKLIWIRRTMVKLLRFPELHCQFASHELNIFELRKIDTIDSAWNFDNIHSIKWRIKQERRAEPSYAIYEILLKWKPQPLIRFVRKRIPYYWEWVDSYRQRSIKRQSLVYKFV